MQRALVAVFLGLAAAGCGGSGTLTASQLEKETEAIDSVAAEGALLAADVERDRTTEPFARIHSGVLSDQAESAVEALHKPAAHGLEDERRREAARARRVTTALDQLHSSPTDPDVAARVRRQLERLAE